KQYDKSRSSPPSLDGTRIRKRTTRDDSGAAPAVRWGIGCSWSRDQVFRKVGGGFCLSLERLGVRHDHPCLDTAEFGHTFGQQLAVANPHEPRAPPDADQFFRHTALDRPGPEFVFPVSGEGKRRTQSQVVHQRGSWF